MSQRFIEFVMMHAQNAALFLRQIPNPKTGEGEVNLELAKLFIDQLEMIQEKTRGNLTNEEAAALRNTVSNLQMAYVEVSQQAPKAKAHPAPASSPEPATDEQRSTPAPEQTPPIASTESEESKKKFTKSYGS